MSGVQEVIVNCDVESYIVHVLYSSASAWTWLGGVTVAMHIGL